MTDVKKTEIRVSADTDSHGLAGSVVSFYSRGHDVTLSCIGPHPINNAIKAVCIANRMLASRGIILGIQPGLINRKIPNPRQNNEAQDWTITVLHLFNRLDSASIAKRVSEGDS